MVDRPVTCPKCGKPFLRFKETNLWFCYDPHPRWFVRLIPPIHRWYMAKYWPHVPTFDRALNDGLLP
jgi:hypothetical protein